MEYFSILNLNKEPFSNSPDPDFFFQSNQHLGCLQKLELSLRLRRGLNVVLGDVGTVKTTLCRQLIRRFADDKAYETHLILDPKYSSPSEFLTTIAEMFTGKLSGNAANDWQLKETIKKYIFQRGVDEDKTVVLIIDEGQKIPKFCLEILREFLNFETNKYKLLQIVIFAQKEFEKTLEQHANFADRINLYHVLEPMSFRDTRLMIQFRLKQSSPGHQPPALFSYPALWAIYRLTRGYPRKIINLCHRSVLTMIIQNQTKVGWRLVRSCVRRALPTSLNKWSRVSVAALVVIAVIALTAGPELKGLEKLMPWKSKVPKNIKAPAELPQFDSDKIQSPPNLSKVQHQPPSDQSSQKSVNKATSKDELDELSNAELKTVLEPGAEAAKVPALKTEALAVIEPGAEAAKVLEPKTEALAVIEPGTEAAKVLEPKTEAPAVIEPGAEAAKVLELKTEAVIEKPDFERRLPSTLGQVALRHNDTLWVLIEKVYGAPGDHATRIQYIESVAALNPHIVDPNHIEAGRLLSLPAIPVETKPLSQNVWWVKLKEKDRLEAAFNVLREYPDKAPPIRIIPCWSRKLGLEFVILLDEHFFDETSARNRLSKLPPGLVSEAGIFSKWDKDTVFYSDPFAH
jgi:general secretion pathway protein A